MIAVTRSAPDDAAQTRRNGYTKISLEVQP
jgi:hypothetical protein